MSYQPTIRTCRGAYAADGTRRVCGRKFVVNFTSDRQRFCTERCATDHRNGKLRHDRAQAREVR